MYYKNENDKHFPNFILAKSLYSDHNKAGQIRKIPYVIVGRSRVFARGLPGRNPTPFLHVPYIIPIRE